MRRIFESATVPSRGRFRPLSAFTLLLLLLVLVSAPWRASLADHWVPETCAKPSPYWRVSVAPARASRGSDETIEFEVTLSEQDDCNTATVDWTVKEGTATAGEDYTAMSGTLTFAPGETAKTISVPFLGQSASTNVETLHLVLTSYSDSGLKSRYPVAVGTIFPEQDTEAPSVTVTSTDVAPVSGAFHVKVRFSEPTTGFEVSDLVVVNGSALRVTRTWSTPANRDPGMAYTISINPDPNPSGDVSVTVPAGVVEDLMGNANTASAPFVIAPVLNPAGAYSPAPLLSCETVSGFAVGGAEADVLVKYQFYLPDSNHVPGSTVAVTQNGVDVVRNMAAGGEVQYWTFEFWGILKDDVTGTVLVQVLPGATRYRGLPSGPSNTLHVAHNWTASISDASATEAPDETIDFEVTLNGRDDCRTVTVGYATADGTATAGEDYTAVSGTLTFAPGETSKTVSVPIIDDSISDSGETFTLTLSNAVVASLGQWPTDIAIADAEATGTISDDDESDSLTARFENVPESHDGSTAFTVELHFSEDIPGLSYTTVAGGLLNVPGANVTGARRLTAGSNQDWLVTVAPGGSDDIAISLPARACGEAAAICIADNRPLSEGISATVQMEPQAAQQSGGPLTARFENVPEAHDGATAFTVELHFSENIPGLSYKTVGGGLFDVTGANVTGARRLTPGSNQDWLVTVAPSVDADVTLTVPGTDDCAAPNAICVGDDRKLEAGASATITVTPIAVTVADTEVEEAEGATLDFVVTMNRASARDIQISYRAYDGTATAGEDYVAVYSSFIMTAGETTKTVSVSVLDDALDEGAETVKFWLSGVRGLFASQLTDPYAVGTIRNSDPMPTAWIARFGRTVAEQVLDAVEARLAAVPMPGMEASLAGQRIGGAALPKDVAERQEANRSRSLSDWLNAGTEPARRLNLGTRTMTERDLLTGSSFALTAATKGSGLISIWGRGAVTRFTGREGDLSVDGEVASGMLGADWTEGAWKSGLLVSHSLGDGGYRGASAGTVTSTLTGIFPWGRYALSERLSVWGVAGYGEGSLTLKPEEQAAIRTDLDLWMAAAGLRGVLVDGGTDGPTLAAKSDAMIVRTASDAVSAASHSVEILVVLYNMLRPRCSLLFAA